MSMRNVRVVVYTQPHCAPCRMVERLLDERDVPYESRDVFMDADALQELEARGYLMTPVTQIGEEWIAGFRREALVDALHRNRVGRPEAVCADQAKPSGA